MAKKKFNKLTKKRTTTTFAKYEKEREAHGTTESLARLVKLATI
ncbi:hypothetical protein [Peribacillus simplex]